MKQSNSPIHIVLISDGADETDAGWLNEATRELGQALAAQPEAVQSVTYTGKESLPQGAKMLDVVFAQQVVVALVPLAAPWVVDKVRAVVRSLFATGKNVTARLHIGSHEVEISPRTTAVEIARLKQRLKSTAAVAPETRSALIIGNASYEDRRLADLDSPAFDVESLAQVLANPEIGGFSQIKTIVDATSEAIKQAIEAFYANRTFDELLVTYFSGHGIRSQSGQLFLAARNTSLEMLRSSGISSRFIKDVMDDSLCRKQLLILDCCYGGAIVEGAKSEHVVGQPVHSTAMFDSGGAGRVIITASDAMQYAFDGENVAGQTENSAFTRHLIEGLKTGKADTDNDGLITVEELYQYAYQNVVPRQTPNISSMSQEGRLIIARNPHQVVEPADLPDSLRQAMSSEDRLYRQGAVGELANLLRSDDERVVLAAEVALRQMTRDDSRSVAQAAEKALQDVTAVLPPAPAPTIKPLPPRRPGAQRDPIEPSLPITPTKPSDTSVVPEPLPENSSGKGALTQVPDAIKGWNWGAFLLSFFWSIGNNTWIGLLALVPYLGLIMVFVLGAKGNEWAWRNKRWDSVEHFKQVQKKWARWGFILTGLGLVFGCLLGLLAAMYG